MIKRILLYPFTLLSYIFGKFSWSSPPWLASIGKLVENKPGYFYGLMFLAATGFVLWIYFDSLPKPVMVKALIESCSRPIHVDAENPPSRYAFKSLGFMHDETTENPGILELK